MTDRLKHTATESPLGNEGNETVMGHVRLASMAASQCGDSVAQSLTLQHHNNKILGVHLCSACFSHVYEPFFKILRMGIIV